MNLVPADSLVGPIISSQAARDGELDVSLFQRLFERSVYARHPFFDQSAQVTSRPAANGSSVYKPFTQLVRVCQASEPYMCYPFNLTLTIQNYRSMPSILMVPSAMFYQDRLVPAARDVQMMRWSQLPNPQIPILFKGCNSEEYCIDEVSCLHLFVLISRDPAKYVGRRGFSVFAVLVEGDLELAPSS